MKKILCFSGGKDSTAMLITLLENDAQIDDIIYVNMGDWMWKAASDHIKKVQERFNVKINIIDASVEVRNDFKRYGFPSMFNRWCTGIKKELMRIYIRERYSGESIVQYIGYCADEEKRSNGKLYSTYDAEYPLIDAGITTSQALQICYDNGFDFGGIYDHHHHFNCWCCSLQKVDELYWIWKNIPDLWDQLRLMQFETDGYFQNGLTIFDFDKKFWERSLDELREKRKLARIKYSKR